MGTSTGVNVAGAIRLAHAIGPGHTIVTVLADGAQRYASRLFNPAFLRARDLPVPEWLEASSPLAVPTPLLDYA
jgi:cysteine synthase A